MPKATAVWLIENTALTFDQIAAFCGLHELEVQSIADEEVAIGIIGFDPIANGQLTRAEIDRCSGRPGGAPQRWPTQDIPRPSPRTKGPRYTPVARRQDKPDAIAWLVRHCPDALGRSDLEADRHHQADHRRDPRAHPLEHGEHQAARAGRASELCTRADLDAALEKAGYVPEPVDWTTATCFRSNSSPGPSPTRRSLRTPSPQFG